MNILITLFLILFSIQSGFAEDDVTLQREDGSNITYYLDEKGSENLLVIIQGSDCKSVAHSEIINDHFAKILNDADVLTVEKYGITKSIVWNQSGDSLECPESYFKYDSPKQRVDDYLQTIHALRVKYKYKDVILLGGSEGALVAAMIASNSDSISAVISINGGGRFFVNDVLHSMSLELPAEAFVEAKTGFLEFKKVVKNSEDMDINMSGHGFRWWKSMLTVDQTEVLLRVKAPLLIIQSELDKSVSPDLAYEQAQVLKQNKSNFEFLLVRNIGHNFHDDFGKNHTSEVISYIQTWLNKNRITSKSM